MIKLIIFDWNGTLFADASACLDGDNEVIKSFNGKPASMKEHRERLTIPESGFYELHGVSKKQLNENSEKMAIMFHEFYEKRAIKCRTRKGAKNLLQWLKRKKIKSIILSNHTNEGINFQVQRLGLNDFISETLGNKAVDSYIKEKTKRARLEEFLKHCEFSVKQTLIIGDSPEEIEIGKSMGIKTVALTGGYYSTGSLKKASPDFLIHNLAEVQKIIKKASLKNVSK